MPTIAQLTAELKDLNRNLNKLKQSAYLRGVTLIRYSPGGTASEDSKVNRKYGKLISSRGSSKPLSNGKRCQSIPLAEIARYAAMIERGKAIGKLEKAIDRCETRLAELRDWVKKLSA